MVYYQAMDMEDLTSAWGFGAVVLTERGFCKSFTVQDPNSPYLRSHVGEIEQTVRVSIETREPSESITPSSVLAVSVLAAALKAADGKLGLLAAALSKVSGYRYWCVEAEREGQGPFTRLLPMDVSSPREAYQALDCRMAPLKLRHSLSMSRPWSKL